MMVIGSGPEYTLQYSQIKTMTGKSGAVIIILFIIIISLTSLFT